MKKEEIISISGMPASGKSKITSILMDELDYTVYRNGDYFRHLAKENNMDVTEFNKYVESHPEIDEKIEYSAKEYAKDHTKFIIDARLGFYAVPNSFKVYLVVDNDEAAKRALGDKERKDTENFTSLEEQKKDLIERYEIENRRYLKLYNIDKTDYKHYDLVIDTTTKTIEEVSKIILEEYKKWLNN